MKKLALTLMSYLCLITPAYADAKLPDIREYTVDAALIRSLTPIKPPAPQKITSLPPEPYVYRVGKGDGLIVHLAVYNATPAFGANTLQQLIPTSNNQDLNQSVYRVDDQGAIYLPIIGKVVVENMSISEIYAALDQKIRVLYQNPQLEVKIVEYRSQHVAVTGEVTTPKEIPLNDVPLRVLDALKLAENTTQRADLASATLQRANEPARPVNLAALLYEGAAEENHVMRNGDVLHVPANHQNKVFVFGEVLSPSTQYMRAGRYTLAEALGDSLGNNPVTSSYLYVVRGAAEEKALQTLATEEDTEKYQQQLGSINVYRLDLSEPAYYALADQFLLQPRDVVYFSSSPITQWSRFINQLLPTGLTGAVNSGANVRSVTR